MLLPNICVSTPLDLKVTGCLFGCLFGHDSMTWAMGLTIARSAKCVNRRVKGCNSNCNCKMILILDPGPMHEIGA